MINHSPNCVCIERYVGDPFIQCVPPTPVVAQEILNPCLPSPCGSNAVCKERNGAGACSCSPEYIGNPYEGCRPECSLNSDCPSNKACIRNKCQDPCPGTCGANAVCQVINHIPSCTCNLEYTGDPFRFCSPIPPERKSILQQQAKELTTFLSICSHHSRDNKPLHSFTMWPEQSVPS